jgi:outer membrane protein assembly factor BamA
VLLNQEWRFPILRPNPFRSGMSALLANGIWGGVFVDLGNAWTENAVVRGADNELRELGEWVGLLGSYGASLRYPLFGPLILRVDAARRFDIEDRRGLFPGEDAENHFSFFIGYNY